MEDAELYVGDTHVPLDGVYQQGDDEAVENGQPVQKGQNGGGIPPYDGSGIGWFERFCRRGGVWLILHGVGLMVLNCRNRYVRQEGKAVFTLSRQSGTDATQ